MPNETKPTIDPMLQELRDREAEVFQAKRLGDRKARCIRFIEHSKRKLEELKGLEVSRDRDTQIERYEVQINHLEHDLQDMEEMEETNAGH